jgi:hypothetical protein
MFSPGLQFYCSPLTCLNGPEQGLCRTPSTYSYGNSLELAPVPNRLYVVCNDGSVQDAYDPEYPIGWEILESENGWAYRITQVGFEPRRCMVSYHSRVESPPQGGKQVGTHVFVSYSREAAIYEEAEDGEPEVTSSISFDVVDKIRNFAWPS